MGRSSDRPLIALTLGDPSGIGPETVLKLLNRTDVYDICRPVLAGSAAVLQAYMGAVGVDLEVNPIEQPEQAAGSLGLVDLVETGSIGPDDYRTGRLSAAAGRFSGDCLKRAIDWALDERVHAVVMPPNNKQALNMGGYHFPGWRETVNHMTGAEDSVQILFGRRYANARVVNHVAFRDIADLITRDNVLNVIRMVDKGLKLIGYDRPRIGVSALNVHGGEGGLFGREEMDHIQPAVEAARAEGVVALGPFPADTVFLGMKDGRFDLVLSMYHDHGNACIKLVEFGYLVNMLAGVPIRIFTVSHGTAFDIAGQGVADETNLVRSVYAAAGREIND